MKKLLIIPLFLLPVLTFAQVTPPNLIQLSGIYIEPTNSAWDFDAPSLPSGCLQVDAQGHFASTGQNCASGNASTSPGGLTNQIQYNSFGSFGGDSHFIWASSTQLMTVTGSLAVTSATSSIFQNLIVTNSTTTSATTTNWAVSGLSQLGTIISGLWNGTKIGLLFGGTNADLSGTGGTNQVLKQSSSGAAITAGTLASTNLSDTANIVLLNGSQTFTGTVNFGGLTASTLTVGGTSIVPIATTTASLGGGLLTAGSCASVTATTTTAINTSMVVNVTPVTYPGDGTSWDGYVGPSNTIIVKVCGLITVTPTATQYNVKVTP